MATTLLFSPLPSTAFLHKNPNFSSLNLLGNFSPASLSISISINNNNANSHCRSSFCVSATAVGYPFATETKGSDASTSSSSSSHLDITKLGISQEIVSALARRGITQLFPIQRAVLIPAMEGRDMIGRAITGSGKTLAFGIPILDNIIRHRNSNSRQRPIPSALVLAPTRELARQVQKEFKESAPRLSSACLYGGVPIVSQMRALRSGIDIAVGTPGRIIDLVERGSLDLSEVKFVVLDEADQMLAVGFQDDVESILGYLPAKKQSMLFSATMPSWINQLSRKYLRNPLTIDLVGDLDQKLADGISLFSAVSTSSGKENMLPGLITRYSKGGKSIIFTRTKSDAEELSRSMHGTLASRALHGNMQQMQRDKTLAAFRDGRFSVLVATDVAARGLDIPNVDLVIHFELPNTSEIFVHRSGRTGRAGKKGTAVLLYTKAQRRAVNTIERDIGCKFEELPRIADGIGNKIGRMDMDESNYERYDSPRSRVGNSTYNFSESQYGSYGGSRGHSSYGGSRGHSSYGESRGQSSYGGSRGHSSYGGSRGQSSYGGSRGQSYGANGSRNRGSRGSNMGRFGSSRDSSISRNPGSRDVHFSNPRTQSNTYDEFDRNRSTEKNTSERKQDGFQSILDMLKEQQ